MHPIDYYVYRICIFCGRHEVPKAIVGIVFMLFVPVLLVLMAVFFQSPLLLSFIESLPTAFVIVCFLVLVVGSTLLTMQMAEKYYSHQKIQELCVRYKDHKMNKYSYYLISMLVVLAGVLLEILGILAVIFVIKINS